MGWVQTYCGTESPAVLSTSNPLAFTACFQDSVLQLWDVLLLLLGLLVLSCQPPTRSRIAFHPPRLPSFQLALQLMLAALPLLSLLAATSEYSAAPSTVVARVLRSLAWGTVAVLLSVHAAPSRYEGLRVVHTRLVQWLQCYVLLSLVSTAFAVYDVAVGMAYQPVITASAVLVIVAATIHSALALTGISALTALSRPSPPPLDLHLQHVGSSSDAYDADDELFSGDSSDDIDRGCLSSFTFSWVTPTIRLGLSQGVLHLSDVAPLPSIDSTSDIAQRFSRIWREQMAGGSPSLLWAFWALLGSVYAWLGLLKFVSDLTVFIGPLLLNSLVSFLTSQSGNDPEPAWHGYLYSAGLIGGVVVSSVLGTQYTYRSRRVSMRVRSALVSLVYAKSLSISGMAKRHFSSGVVTNVMSVDTERVMDVATSFHDFWSLPVQIAVALVLLHAQVGLALLAGLGVVLLLIPLNALLTQRIASVSRRMMRFKDRRVQLLNELLHQVRAIKSLALEPRFQRRIASVRRREMRALTTRKYLDALCVYFWATTPILVSLATFAMYVGLGHQLTAAKVFTALALFNTLIRPLNSFPWVINGLVEGQVSALRVYRFLCAEDRGQGAAVGERDGGRGGEGVAVEVEGSFAYQKVERNSGANVPGLSSTGHTAGSTNGHAPLSTRPSALPAEAGAAIPTRQSTETSLVDGAKMKMKAAGKRKRKANGQGKESVAVTVLATPAYIFHLEDVSLRVRVGEFVGICGTVGSGKSSLLLAMLGELWGMKRAQLPPRVHVCGRVAYVAQEAWIQNATLRANVLFGLPYDERRYRRVLEAVALTADLRQLPAGDMTEIGEGGINLSGGQKVRVSIARAAYADCDVYLLDDILSAVDVHVGAHLVARLVHGLLADKTVCLVTHHTHFLQNADQIVQMKAGRIERLFQSEGSGELRRRGHTLTDGAIPELPPSALPGDAVEPPPESLVAQLKAKEIEKEEEERLARLTVDESRQRGAIRRRVLSVYLAQIGGWLVALILLSMVLMQGSRNYNDFYLGQWAADADVAGVSSSSSSSLISPSLLSSLHPLSALSSVRAGVLSYLAVSPRLTSAGVGDDEDGLSHLRILALIALFNSLAALFRAFIFAYGGLVAARHMFDALLGRVLYARIAFFDENPVSHTSRSLTSTATSRSSTASPLTVSSAAVARCAGRADPQPLQHGHVQHRREHPLPGQHLPRADVSAAGRAGRHRHHLPPVPPHSAPPHPRLPVRSAPVPRHVARAASPRLGVPLSHLLHLQRDAVRRVHRSRVRRHAALPRQLRGAAGRQPAGVLPVAGRVAVAQHPPAGHRSGHHHVPLPVRHPAVDVPRVAARAAVPRRGAGGAGHRLRAAADRHPQQPHRLLHRHGEGDRLRRARGGVPRHPHGTRQRRRGRGGGAGGRRRGGGGDQGRGARDEGQQRLDAEAGAPLASPAAGGSAGGAWEVSQSPRRG